VCRATPRTLAGRGDELRGDPIGDKVSQLHEQLIEDRITIAGRS
jgi:hypothetical protein